MPQYWVGTRHFFLLILHFKNIEGGDTCPFAPPPYSAVPVYVALSIKDKILHKQNVVFLPPVEH